MRLEELEEGQKPYVAFRMPQEKAIQLYVQDDQRLCTTQDFSEKGFVFSSFTGGRHYYIAADKVFTLAVPITDVDPHKETPQLPIDPTEQKAFEQHVLQAKAAIKKGKFKKVVLSRPIQVVSEKSPLQAFQALTALYANAFVYCVFHPKIGCWLGATPERFVSLHQGSLHTMSLAGTLPYSSEEPQWSSKELYEQALVTESIVNDLIKAFPNSSPQLGALENLRAGALYHLRTKIALHKTSIDLVKAVHTLHPTPAVGGLPKREALDFIAATEDYDREYYTGFLGPFSKKVQADLFVNLRCAKFENKAYTLYVGAGITADSDPQKEFLETQRKAQTLSRSLLF